ncbi:MAG TPA: sigma-54 dependent transcriptional regulator [Polyangiaceae bacterium]|nr:sigma-54 dependent transcriptional regulator [Polyangiaceae bacterium]
MKASVLIVDDERVFRVLAEEALTSEGFEVRGAPNLAKARAELTRSQPDVVVLDRRLPDGDGLDLLREERRTSGDGPLFVVVTAYGDIQNAVDAVQAGAVDYLAKPVQPTDLVMKLRKVLEVRGLRDRLARARGAPTQTEESQSAKMRAVMDTLRRVSQSPLTPVFILGASGSGKQYAAEQLHAMSHGGAGSDAPFIDVNCAALPSNLVESELFGHERGAFTDAKGSRRGLIELADGGTLFLDEIGELPEASQAKLLKFLDSMRFRRVGGERELEVALRVIAATNQDVEALVKSGRFREDLYHRLSVFVVQVPPLAQRREEVAALAGRFIEQCARKTKKRVEGINEAALALLEAYEFPGNVRELRNIIERAVILARGSEITPEDLVLRPPAARPDRPHAFFEVELPEGQAPPPMHAVEHAYVMRVLEHHEGRRMQAAQALGISYPTFLKRLRELGIASE